MSGREAGRAISAKPGPISGAEDRKLFVGGLSWETKEPQLKDYFEKFGEIESINLKLDPVTGRSRCFAFLVFKEPSSVSQVATTISSWERFEDNLL